MMQTNPEKKPHQAPKAIAGVYIFNANNELLLARSPKWNGKYCNIGGKIEFGETAEEAAARETKEETNLELERVKFAFFINGLQLEKDYQEKEKHLIFLDFIAYAKNPEQVKLSPELSSYRWDTIENWMKRDKSEFAPYIYEYLPKLENAAKQEDFEHLYLRALADYRNLANRIQREKSELVKFGNERLILELLPVYSNLKLALAHAGNAEQNGNNIDEGIRHVIRQFREVLENSGVKEIDTAGQEFDHATMEAVDKKPTGSREQDGKVAEELKPGYILNGKVIEPAKVVVWEYEK